LQDFLTTGKAKFSGYGREVEALSKDGTRLTVELSVGEAAQGGRRLFVGVLHDVTERQRAAIRQLELLEQVKQSEAEARKQQALFRSVFESAPKGIVLTDTQHRATMVNPALQRIFGYDADELIGALPSKFYARPEFWKPIDEATNSTGNGNPTRTFQIVRCKRKNGAVFPGATIRVPYRDSRGNLYGYLRIFRDVTPEQRREEERRQAQRLESLGELTGGIAHDFNNLLTVISGNLQLLEMKLGDERLAHYLSEAKHAVHMGERLSQRLVTFASQRRLTPAPANLNEQVNNMLELLRRTIGGQITVTTVLADNLWRTLVDISEVENAILNLAINARDAMPNGGKLIIETGNLLVYDRGQYNGEESPPGSYVRLAVSDTGSGMTPEVLARAFEPYFTTKEPGKGTGLGLASVYGFVKQSGGHGFLARWGAARS
ncbi:MAG TPA: PAS domain S-box protein, partial [Methylocella sp.]|nr:PAS domain S-box protein [Methylocella sp.]